MKKPMYELIETVMMYLFGTLAIVFVLLMVACVEGFYVIPAVICFVVGAVCISISVKIWEMQEGRNNVR